MQKRSTIKLSNQDGDESAIIRMKYYNPRDVIIQHLPLKKT